MLELYLFVKIIKSFSSAGVFCHFFVFVFVFSVVAESESFSGVSYDSESSSSAAPSSLLVFCAAHSLSLSATVLLILRRVKLFEPELVDSFLGKSRAVGVDGEFVEPLLLWFRWACSVFVDWNATMAYFFITHCSSSLSDPTNQYWSRIVKFFSLFLYIIQKTWFFRTGGNFINVGFFVVFIYFDSLWLFNNNKNFFRLIQCVFVHEL